MATFRPVPELYPRNTSAVVIVQQLPRRNSQPREIYRAVMRLMYGIKNPTGRGESYSIACISPERSVLRRQTAQNSYSPQLRTVSEDAKKRSRRTFFSSTTTFTQAFDGSSMRPRLELDWTSIGPTHEQILEKWKCKLPSRLPKTYFAANERGFSWINPKGRFRHFNP